MWMYVVCHKGDIVRSVRINFRSSYLPLFNLCRLLFVLMIVCLSAAETVSYAWKITIDDISLLEISGWRKPNESLKASMDCFHCVDC